MFEIVGPILFPRTNFKSQLSGECGPKVLKVLRQKPTAPTRQLCMLTMTYCSHPHDCAFVSKHTTFATARGVKSPQQLLLKSLWILFRETFGGRLSRSLYDRTRVTLTRPFSTCCLLTVSRAQFVLPILPRMLWVV